MKAAGTGTTAEIGTAPGTGTVPGTLPGPGTGPFSATGLAAGPATGPDRAITRALTVPLAPTHPGGGRRRRAALAKPGVLPGLWLLLGALFSIVLGCGSAPLSLLCGLGLVAASGALLLQSDYRWALRVERGRLFLLRNGVAVFDASVLPEGEVRLVLEGRRLEALRCRPGDPPSYVFGVPLLQLGAADAQRVRERIQVEQGALEHISRQLELLDDPDVQTHLLQRLRGEERGRPGALRAALLSASQDGSARGRAAQAVLGYSSSASPAARPPDSRRPDSRRDGSPFGRIEARDGSPFGRKEASVGLRGPAGDAWVVGSGGRRRDGRS
jgi:hypothetical protein